jgi:uncharacterized protein
MDMSNTIEQPLSSEGSRSRPRSQGLIVAIVLALFAAGAVALSSYGWRQSVLFLIGGLLGISLYRASFGFTSAYRKLFVQRDVSGMYAQLLMLAIATVLFAPLLASGSAWGQEVRGAVAPVGIQGAIGALIFGIGMQLGSGCGCGTLYTIGGGSLPMLLTLVTFCIGSFIASLTRQFWAPLPAIPPISLGKTVGWSGAVILQLGLFLLLAGLLWWWSKGRKTQDASPLETASPALFPHSFSQFFYGPWSLLTGAIALAILNWATLIISGQPWRVTWGFAVWAAQFAKFLGWNPANSPFWSGGAGQQALSQSIFADVSSVMNIGIVLGALFAAALAGQLILKTQFSTRLIVATLLGGLLMGYGALIAYGCNVSAFFSGIASTSLHGWVWIVAALLGTTIGIRLRSLFRL